jgi:hypothetical protein
LSGLAEYRGETLKLDTFTQAPIDGALVSFKVPVNLKATVFLSVDDHRYPERWGDLRSEDTAFLERVLKQAMEEDAMMLGHARAAGFGWFKMVEDGK